VLRWAVDGSNSSAVMSIKLVVTPKLSTKQQGERLLKEGRLIGGYAECFDGLLMDPILQPLCALNWL